MAYQVGLPVATMQVAAMVSPNRLRIRPDCGARPRRNLNTAKDRGRLIAEWVSARSWAVAVPGLPTAPSASRELTEGRKGRGAIV